METRHILQVGGGGMEARFTLAENCSIMATTFWNIILVEVAAAVLAKSTHVLPIATGDVRPGNVHFYESPIPKHSWPLGLA